MSSLTPEPSIRLLTFPDEYLEKWVRMVFKDGTTVDGRIVEIDSEEHDDIVYELDSPPRDAYHQALIRDIVSIAILPHESSGDSPAD